MTLTQKLDRLISRWQGSDAKDRSARRDQLVSHIVSLVEKERARQQTGHTRQPSKRSIPTT